VTDPVVVLVCADCQKDLETCAACQRTDCPNGTCYACLVIELGLAHPHPHEHGG
jgi:hypothetical protein